jgi:Mg-chelatase subunit ChlD
MSEPNSEDPLMPGDVRPDRWRLVLGRYAQQQLGDGAALGPKQQRMERALDYLYGREYRGRGVRAEQSAGSLDPSVLSVPHWLNEVRELFPKETVERIEKHALDRYGMTELVTDPAVLAKLEANMDLLKAVLTFRGQMKGAVLQEARRVIRKVVDEITRRLQTEVRNTLTGRLNRFSQSRMKVAANLDWRTTIRRNLKNFDRERNRIIVDDVRFFSRVQRRLPWTVILCVDQSGSMTESVVHSAVMAGILAGLPLVKVKLVVFDTAVVDLSDHADDPVEVLMSVQLGGGTDIGKALTYCTQLVDDPLRTVLVLVSDFCEGASPGILIGACRKLAEARVKLLGLAALDDRADAIYDRQMAERLAEAGMEIAALTPGKLAEWLAAVINK